MCKYTPSVLKNNRIKESFIKEANALVYRVEKGRVNAHLNREEIRPLIDALKVKIGDLENALGTGKEILIFVYEDAKNCLKELEKKIGQELTSQVEEAIEELSYSIDTWKDVIDGNLKLSEEDLKRAKVTWTKKKLISRLEELENLKQEFSTNESRLEKDLTSLEKDKAELDSLITKENNERRINELYRKITSANSKIDSLNVRRSSYSACFDLLDIIHSNGKEIIAASDYSAVDLARAKAYLDISKLRTVMNEPDKALSILKRMENDIKEIVDKTASINSKILSINTGETTVNQDALAYKEELMKKKKDKETLDSIGDEIEQINSENKNEIM